MRPTEEVLPNPGKPVNTNSDRVQVLWEKEQAAAFYKISVRTLEERMRQKRVPFLKLGGAVRFHPDVLNAHAIQNSSVTGGRK